MRSLLLASLLAGACVVEPDPPPASPDEILFAPSPPRRPPSLLGVHSLLGDAAWETAAAALFGGRGGWLVEVAYSTDPDWVPELAASTRRARELGHEPVVRIDYARPDGTAWASATLDAPAPTPGATIPPPGAVGWCLKRAPTPWEPSGGPAVRVPDETHLGCWLAYIDGAVRALDGVHTWIVGNEMNVDLEARGFPGGRIAPAHYADVYRRTRAAIRSIPGHEQDAVLVGGVSPGVAGTSAYRSGKDYLAELLYLLAPDDVDGLTVHAYGGYPGGTPSSLDIFRDGPGGDDLGYRDTARWVDALGHSRTPLLITEFSAHVRPGEDGTPVAQFLADAARDLHEWNQGPGNHAYLGAVWFTWDDAGFATESLARHAAVRGAFQGAAAAYPAGDPARVGTCAQPPAGAARWFPETGQEVRGALLSAWNARGLQAIGYPIGGAGCAADSTGRILWSQWFQRHRLEWHPEAQGTPYEVMLGFAGAIGARAAGFDPDDWTPQPRPAGTCELIGPGPGQGKWVCGALLTRFRRDGLELIGYPISPEIDHGGVRAQWFQRARLELHPHGVEGGLLGCEQTGWSTVPGCQ